MSGRLARLRDAFPPLHDLPAMVASYAVVAIIFWIACWPAGGAS